MLFAFRGIRAFQAVLSLAALACGVGAVLLVKTFADGGSAAWLLLAAFLGLVFLWAFATTLRAPTSFVAVDLERQLTRIRFAGFEDFWLAGRYSVAALSASRSRRSATALKRRFRTACLLVSSSARIAL